MKKVFPVKLLNTARFPSPATQCFSIIKRRFFKERFFAFKGEEWMLKDTDSIFTGTETGPSPAETVKLALHSAV